MPTEPNLIMLRRKLAKKCTIFVPFMVDKSLKMVKLRLPLFVSKFGIKEARDSNAYKKKDRYGNSASNCSRYKYG
jgi:5-formyltetrahydrofolate cyclo-ligase